MTCARDLSDRRQDRGALFRDGDRGVDGPRDPRRRDRDHILFVSLSPAKRPTAGRCHLVCILHACHLPPCSVVGIGSQQRAVWLVATHTQYTWLPAPHTASGRQPGLWQCGLLVIYSSRNYMWRNRALRCLVHYIHYLCVKRIYTAIRGERKFPWDHPTWWRCDLNRSIIPSLVSLCIKPYEHIGFISSPAWNSVADT